MFYGTTILHFSLPTKIHLEYVRVRTADALVPTLPQNAVAVRRSSFLLQAPYAPQMYFRKGKVQYVLWYDDIALFLTNKDTS